MIRDIALAAMVLAAVTVSVAHAQDEPAIRIPISDPNTPHVDVDAARALFNDVNVARARRRLPALAYDGRLASLARKVAEDMATRHYFGHTDPRGVTFADRMHASRYHFSVAAENMSFDTDEASANRAFRRSADHYANIVDPEERKVGTAVVVAGDEQIFFVEDFAG